MKRSEFVERGLRILAEDRKRFTPRERFDRMVQAGIIDERGRLLHQDDDGSTAPLRELLHPPS